MNRKTWITVLLLTAALLLNACNQQTPDPATGDSDTAAHTQKITETVPDAPAIPETTEPQTEPLPEPQLTETTDVPTETEPQPEITEPLPELPAEEPVEDTVDTTVGTTESAETAVPAPVIIVKPTVDITDHLIPGGEPVSGQIASAQSETLRLLLDYTVEQSEDGSATLTLNVGLSCYELWCSAKTDMGTITVNGVSRTFSTNAIDHMAHEKTYIPFLTQTYNTTGNQSASIEVSWCFNGSYSGAEIGTLSTGLILVYGPEDSATPTPTEPPVTEPVVTEPVVTESVVTEPDVTEPEQPYVPPIELEPTEEIPPQPTETTSPADPVSPAEPVDSNVPQEPTVPTDPNASQEPNDPNVPENAEQEQTGDVNPVVPGTPPPPEEAGTP